MPPNTGMCAFALAAAMVLSGRQAAALPQDTQDTQAQQGTTPMVPTYVPAEFIAEYNYSYCPSNSTAIYVPPVVAIYPYSSEDVYGLVGDYFNITWINPAIVTTHSGQDNTVGAVRNQSGDPFAAMEYLTQYYRENSTDGFYYQQGARVGYPMTIQPGYVELDSHLVVDLKPACDRAAAQFGFYLTFCMSADEPDQAQKLSDGAVAGAAGSLKHLWQMLDGARNTTFNTTQTCAAVSQYQAQSQVQTDT